MAEANAVQGAGAAGWRTQPLGEVSDAARLAWCINQQTAGNTPEEHSIKQQFATGPDSKDVRRSAGGQLSLCSKSSPPHLCTVACKGQNARLAHGAEAGDLQGPKLESRGEKLWASQLLPYASAGLVTFPEQHGNLL